MPGSNGRPPACKAPPNALPRGAPSSSLHAKRESPPMEARTCVGRRACSRWLGGDKSRLRAAKLPASRRSIEDRQQPRVPGAQGPVVGIPGLSAPASCDPSLAPTSPSEGDARQGSSPARALLKFDRVAYQPEHGRPEADEQGSPLRVSSLLLVNCLRADPERDAEVDRRERGHLEVPAAETHTNESLGQHSRPLPRPQRVHA